MEPQHCLAPTYPKLSVSSRCIHLSHMGQTLQNGVRLATSIICLPLSTITLFPFPRVFRHVFALHKYQKHRDINYEMLLRECGLTTLETRRLRGDQIEVFKIVNGYENIDRNIFFWLVKREGLEEISKEAV